MARIHKVMNMREYPYVLNNSYICLNMPESEPNITLKVI